MKDFVIVESLDEDLSKTKGGIYVQQSTKPYVGHYKVLSVGNGIENCEIKVGDTIWSAVSNVSTSSNFGNDKVGVVKYTNIIARD